MKNMIHKDSDLNVGLAPGQPNPQTQNSTDSEQRFWLPVILKPISWVDLEFHANSHKLCIAPLVSAITVTFHLLDISRSLWR